ncbi:MAG: hypothetical protein ACXWV4_09525 [Flavitalea sp.]
MRGLIAVCAIVIASFFIIYCTKRAETKIAPPDHQEVPSYVVDGGGSASCNCVTGQASCKADCFFTECCICWNPSQSEGGCACYFGFSSCKTAPIKTSVPQVLGAEKEHEIKVKDQLIREYFDYMDRRNIRTQNLKGLYSKMIGFSKGSTVEKNVKILTVGSVAYDEFYKAYIAFIAALPVEKQNELKVYLNSKK